MIVVTTPTGNIGHQVVERLLERGERVRVVVRDPGKLAASVRERVEVVMGSHGDAATIDRALDGADALFWLVPPDFQAESAEALMVDFTRPAAAAIRRHGVRHVVAASNLGRGTAWEQRAGVVTASLAKDDMLAATGAAFRALALPGFMDNMLMNVGTLEAQGAFHWTLDPHEKHPTVATRDIAAVAAGLLLDRGWTGAAEVPVPGPEDLSPEDHARIMTEVLGRPIRYRRATYEAVAARLREHGASPGMAEGFIAMMRAKDHGLDDGAVRSSEVVTPTTFRQWCEEVLKPAMVG